ncbi:hypothetical protein D3C86_1825690 [compost metagenome]
MARVTAMCRLSWWTVGPASRSSGGFMNLIMAMLVRSLEPESRVAGSPWRRMARRLMKRVSSW